MIVHDDAYYESRMPVKDLGPVKNFLRFVWDDERKAFLDRTAKDWAYLGIFYLCFFGVLFSIFAFQMWITLYYISGLDKPYMQHSSQVVRSFYTTGARPFFRSPFAGFGNPGLGFAPNVLTPTTSPIIWVSQSSEKSRPEVYIKAIKNFLEGYQGNPSSYDENCVDGRFRPGFGGKPCFFDTNTLGKCSIPPYGYTLPYQPCVYLKFNKRFDWIPIYYNETSELPETMPMKLRKVIKTSDKFHVWLSCDGASNVDKENIGEINYVPTPGFPVQYFPFAGQRDYASPVVALVFNNLTANRLVTVECSVWAQNIRQDKRYSLDFQIMIGEDPRMVAQASKLSERQTKNLLPRLQKSAKKKKMLLTNDYVSTLSTILQLNTRSTEPET